MKNDDDNWLNDWDNAAIWNIINSSQIDDILEKDDLEPEGYIEFGDIKTKKDIDSEFQDDV